MSKRKFLGLLSVFVISIVLGVCSHYWFSYKNYLYFQLAFLGENQKIFPINIIAGVKARKIETSLIDFLESNNDKDIEYRQFFTGLQENNINVLRKYIDPQYQNKYPDKTEQGAKEFLAAWPQRADSTIEYILPGEKYSYLIHSFNKKQEKVCVIYRFRIDGENVFYSPIEGHPILYGLLSDRCIAISDGWYGGIAPENKHYNVAPLSYLEYWMKLMPLNSRLDYGIDENSFSLYFDSYRFEDSDSSLAIDLKKLFSGFVTALEDRNTRKFSEYVTKETFERLSPIFEDEYQSNYQEFKESFNDVGLYSYIDAAPLGIVYFRVPENRYLEPLFVLKENKGIRYSGIGYSARSSNLFRSEDFKNYMVR